MDKLKKKIKRNEIDGNFEIEIFRIVQLWRLWFYAVHYTQNTKHTFSSKYKSKKKKNNRVKRQYVGMQQSP